MGALFMQAKGENMDTVKVKASRSRYDDGMAKVQKLIDTLEEVNSLSDDLAPYGITLRLEVKIQF